MSENEAARNAFNAYRKLPFNADGDYKVLDFIRPDAKMTASLDALESTAHQLTVRNQED